MSKENVELVREAWETLKGNPYDLNDVYMSFQDADVVYEDDILPDHVGETYYGHEGQRKAWAVATEPWENLEVDLEWARDAGDQVVSCHRARGRGKESGIEVEFRYAYVWRFRGGKVIYYKSYGDTAEALKAAGLEG